MSANSMIKLIDTHTHLEEMKDIAQAMASAEASGLFAVITMGSDLESNKQAFEISGTYGKTTVYPALGIHPWRLEDCHTEPAFDFIEDNIKKAVAVGEIGLDFWLKTARKNPSKRQAQKEVFRRLLDLAKRYNKPVSIHTRGAWEESLDLTVKAGVEKAVFHWYSGPLDVLDSILAHGYLISATPAAEYSQNHQAVIASTPLEKMLLETDSPVKYGGIPSEPAHVLRTLDAVSKIKHIPKEDVAAITTQNALKFFELENQENHDE
jgi:TatD DNase family protein